MKWLFDDEKNVWNLYDNSSIIARIFIKEKPENKRKFLAKTLIASVYFGAQTFTRLTKKNKEWKVTQRKFHTREEMEKYLEAKKIAVLKLIEKM